MAGYYHIYPILAFISFVVSLIPLPWHVQAWNSGTCAFMVWTSFACLIKFVNFMIWRGNVANHGVVWCDVFYKLAVGVFVGIPASILCISRRLYILTVFRNVNVTKDDKRRMILEDLCITVGLPLLIMLLHIIIQPHRLNVLKDIGCDPVAHNTVPAYSLLFIFPIALGLTSFVYSALTLRVFYICRLEFSLLTQISEPHHGLNVNRCFRLMFMVILDNCLVLPLAIYCLYIAVHDTRPASWISWTDTHTHTDLDRVVLVPDWIWMNDKSFRIAVELERWRPIALAFLLFGFFGFDKEARTSYTHASSRLANLIGIKTRKSLVRFLAREQRSTTTPTPICMPLKTIPILNVVGADDSDPPSYEPFDVEKCIGSSPSLTPLDHCHLGFHDFATKVETPPSFQGLLSSRRSFEMSTTAFSHAMEVSQTRSVSRYELHRKESLINSFQRVFMPRPPEPIYDSTFPIVTDGILVTVDTQSRIEYISRL